MSMTRGAMVFMAFWRAAICFLMLSSSWCSLFWEQPQTGAGVGGGGGGRVGAGVGGPQTDVHFVQHFGQHHQ